ncbi:uncharacterized protein LOC131625952 [Vicia villosa]|uniref:uncharacterized protein LOC131625952 n=1 Tax=Vicia villosa TaxID=3911 RepID=UPI00273C4A8C|nr:uncharacterized protein LOC131625952 [Vicia villosa]
MRQQEKFKSRDVYRELQVSVEDVQWKSLFFKNLARLKAKFIMWVACHNRLATKERLHRFGLLNSICCCFCNATETLTHLMFECVKTRVIWKYVLDWLQINHTPRGWNEEMRWMLDRSKGKGSKLAILKCAFTEIVYET